MASTSCLMSSPLSTPAKSYDTPNSREVSRTLCGSVTDTSSLRCLCALNVAARESLSSSSRPNSSTTRSCSGLSIGTPSPFIPAHHQGACQTWQLMSLSSKNSPLSSSLKTSIRFNSEQTRKSSSVNSRERRSNRNKRE